MELEVSPDTAATDHSIPLGKGISEYAKTKDPGIGCHDNAAFVMDEDLKCKDEKVESEIQVKENREVRRNLHISSVREFLKSYTSDNGDRQKTSFLPKDQVRSIFSERKFTDLMFLLFDDTNVGTLSQNDWLSSIKANSSSFHNEDMVKDLVELVQASSNSVCHEELITKETFHTIWNCEGVAEKMTKLIGSDELISEVDFMDFIMKITACSRNRSTLTKEDIDHLNMVFKNTVGKEEEFTLTQFKKIAPPNNNFFVERAFHIFDKNGNGRVSRGEFIETMHQFSRQGEDEKISFLFKVYDINGDGEIDENELQHMMKACMNECGMNLEDKDIDQLAEAFFQDAVREGCTGITVEDLKLQLKKYDKLLENMNISVVKWLVPSKPNSGKAANKIWENRPQIFTLLYWANNFSFAFFMLIIALINIILFVHRAYYFRNFANLDGSKPNPFYMISRGFGRVLLFSSILVLVLVLRYSLTFLRNLGLCSYIPVDHNIFIHKVIGWTIFGSAWIHSLMHFCNFAINVQPNPVKFLQVTAQYWKDHTQNHTQFGYLFQMGYNPPPGCKLVATRESALDCLDDLDCELDWNALIKYNCSLLQYCPQGDPEDPGLSVCQACPQNVSAPWSYFHFILTRKPGVFGRPGGMANPTGVALLAIITVMTICSLPFIRRSGYFLVFHFSHRLYYLYWGILFLHAPEWWKWFLAFGVIFAIEKIYRAVFSLLGHGKSVIQDGIILPSKVTNLVIKRSHGFKFSPGDWVFIKIPKLTKYEWHPFTISSAPEVEDTFTLHIRGVGSWTNKLYAHFEEYKTQSKLQRHTSVFKKITDSLDPPRALEMENKPPFDSGSINIEHQSENHNRKRCKPLEIHIDGPFGSPSSDIYRAEHAVLIATGIGVTPYASILQSIMHRYWKIKLTNPNYQFTGGLGKSMFNLKKVDFIWINRDQKCFEWFVKLLSQLEIEQAELCGTMANFLEISMYVTSAPQKTDMKAVGLQLALDLLYQKEKRDLVTGLKSRTNAGRPNWNKVFTKIREQNKGRVTVFYCGNTAVAKIIREKCAQFGFTFKKEVF